MNDYSSCLRPIFTEDIVTQICDRQESINLIGEADLAREKLLADIQRMLPKDVIQATVNLKNNIQSHDLMLKELEKSLNIKLVGRYRNIPRLVEKLPKDKLVVIFFEKFDALMDLEDNKMDEKYNFDFIASINNTKNKKDICIVCLTKEIPKNLTFRGETSPLDLQIESIESLTYSEIENYWQECLPKNWWSWLQNENSLLTEINTLALKKNDSLHWVEWISKQIIRQNSTEKSQTWERKLKKWKQDYSETFSKNMNRKELDGSNWLKKRKDRWGLNFGWSNLISVITKLFGNGK
jgi:hypothetical protein